MSPKERDRRDAGNLSAEAERLLEDGLPPLTAAQMREVERRLQEYERNPASAIPLDEVLRDLESRLRCMRRGS